MMEAEAIKTMQSNMNFVSDTALNLRLSTEEVLYKIELYLRGKRLIPRSDPETNVVTYYEQECGEQKANEIGIQSIMGYLSSILNTSVVQGNFDATRFQNYIYRERRNMSIFICQNSTQWDIKEHYMEYIVDTIMANVEPFVSRLLENKERESYANTIQSRETNNVKNQNPQFVN